MTDNAPDLSEQLRTVAGQVLSGDSLDSFVKYVPLDAYTTSDGQINEEKVMGHLTALHANQLAQLSRQFGQYSGQPPGARPGAEGRAALKKRHNVGADTNQPAAGGQVARGSSAKAELEKRYGKGKR